jgi:lipoprotein-anchoring transpeptidase ErfK/SrfK
MKAVLVKINAMLRCSPLSGSWFYAMLFATSLSICGAQESVPTKDSQSSQKVHKPNAPAIIFAPILEKATDENLSVVIMLGKQRAYLKVDNEIAIDSPVSTGKRQGMTPPGNYIVVQKNSDHRSNLYGSFIDAEGRTVRSGVSARRDVAPPGTSFVGAPMKWFMRLGKDPMDYSAMGMHAGDLPGYPASHGCIRLPAQIARAIFLKAPLGMPVCITE